jgi:hypothetical protein
VIGPTPERVFTLDFQKTSHVVENVCNLFGLHQDLTDRVEVLKV